MPSDTTHDPIDEIGSESSWDNLRPLNPVRLHRLILDQLHELMRTGQLQPGEPLPSERHLAERLGVSRGTLREALRILEHEGIVVTRAGGGRRLRRLADDGAVSPDAYVDSLRKAASVDLMEARQALEERIVELACLRATEEDLEAIRAALHGTAPEGGDHAFHLAIAAASHNFVFVRMMRLHVDLVQGIRQRILTAERRKEMEAEHAAIYEAIAARDPERARAAMIHHRERVIDLLRTAPEVRPRGAS